MTEETHWFAADHYWKTYLSGPMVGQQVEVDKDEFNFWKREGEALWGYVDFWGDFEPGLLRPELPVVEVSQNKCI